VMMMMMMMMMVNIMSSRGTYFWRRRCNADWRHYDWNAAVFIATVIWPCCNWLSFSFGFHGIDKPINTFLLRLIMYT
jgi:hypothetical protein